MLIDVHMHVGKLYFTQKETLTPRFLLKFMDESGIDKACLLPMENPEHTDYYILTDYVLQVCRRHPDRFIPFCNVDPRRRKVPELLRKYRDLGCVGYGETISGLNMDDPLMQVVYETCGKLGMPIIFDLMLNANYDEPGLPRYEKMLRKYKDTIFIGHGPHYWAEIEKAPAEVVYSGYPKGPVKTPGAVVKHLRKYPNAYADISAGSGHNALTRDPEFGLKFLEEFQNKLLFGSDICRRNYEVVNVPFFHGLREEKKISRRAWEKIAWKNAVRLLKLK